MEVAGLLSRDLWLLEASAALVVRVELRVSDRVVGFRHRSIVRVGDRPLANRPEPGRGCTCGNAGPMAGVPILRSVATRDYGSVRMNWTSASISASERPAAPHATITVPARPFVIVSL